MDEGNEWPPLNKMKGRGAEPTGFFVNAPPESPAPVEKTLAVKYTLIERFMGNLMAIVVVVAVLSVIGLMILGGYAIVLDALD